MEKGFYDFAFWSVYLHRFNVPVFEVSGLGPGYLSGYRSGDL